MITSLLSLYIATTIQPSILPENYGPRENIELASTSTLQISSLISQKNIPIKNHKYISPIIDASGSISIDMESEEIIYEKNAHQRLQIASITKIMTALIILEENSFEETTIVSNNAASTEGSTMYLRSGEEISIENLLYGIIINSANDAAVALAEHNAGSVNAFVEKMNTKALSLGLVNTNFANPIGLDNSNNYSSAFDIAKLAKQVYQNEFIKEAAQKKEFTVYSQSKTYKHILESTNDLLGNEYLNIKGLKTGRTDAAGLCLVAVAESDSENEVITVVLNSPARFTETKVLVDWVFRAYNWQN